MKKFMSLTLAVIMMLSISVCAFAAESENITAMLDRKIKVTYDGELQTFTDVNGKIVYPVVYEGTTYLPVRAVSALVGLPVEWDGANYTVVLGGNGEATVPAKPVETPLTNSETIHPVLDKNIKVTYDGQLQTFTDVNGKVVYPIVYNGTTYLPVRAVSGLVDLPVEWDGASYTVVLGENYGFKKGTINGNYYENTFADIHYNLPKNAQFSSDSEIQELFGDLELDGSTYDMMAVNNDDGTITVVMFEDLSSAGEVTEFITADVFVDILQAGLPEGYTVLGTEKQTLGGNEYTVLKTSLSSNGSVTAYQNYYIMKTGSYLTCIIITGSSPENINASANCFN